jgi:preprotein translocase subunit SecB
MTTATTAQPEFIIQRLYNKDISFESPAAPEIFKKNLQPMINVDIQTTPTKIETDIFEVSLTTTITATAENQTVFLVEVKQAGIFTIKNIPDENLGVILHVTCPTILFPFLRETVSDLVARGGFQHFYLSPINFEALYINSLEKQKAGGNNAAANNNETETSH